MKLAKDIFMYYKNMEKTTPGSSMLQEVKLQYADMARGGDGGSLGYTPSDFKGKSDPVYGPSCREYNYPKYPDSFFQEVCALMNWQY